MLGLVELCHDLGGRVLVHGSPNQRPVSDAGSLEAARRLHLAILKRLAMRPTAGITYCLEPLAPALTDFINTVAHEDAVSRSGSQGLATMLDTSAAWGGESQSPAAVLDQELPSGMIRHVHFNESNRRGTRPGRALLHAHCAGACQPWL
jgi:D-psicose/D-tagatose/L-ribulose 3-epimerase